MSFQFSSTSNSNSGNDAQNKPAFSFGSGLGGQSGGEKKTEGNTFGGFSFGNSGPDQNKASTGTGFGFNKPEDNNKPLFGAAASGAGGTAGSTGSTGGGLFGGASGSTGGSLFGSKTQNAPGGSLFGGASNNNTTSTDSKPSFSFGQSNNTTSNGSSLFGSANTTNSGAKPLFGSAKPENSTTDSKPALFGAASNTSNSTSLFGANTEKKEAKNDAPLFGAKSTDTGSSLSQDKPATPGGLFGAQSSNKPSFSFGNSSAAPKEKPSETPSQGLFGASSTQQSSGGLFGPKSDQDSKTTSTPSFSFNAKPEEKKSDDSKADSNAFSLAAKAPEPTSETAKPSFSFGAKPSDVKDTASSSTPASTFSFGGAKASSDKPSDSTKPAGGFSFGEKKETNNATKPTGGFSFGSKPSEPSQSTSGFSFGAKKDDKSEAGDGKTSAPSVGFSFGNKEGEKKEAKDSTFSFGSKAADEKPKTSFSFGAKPDEKKDESSPSTFSFGTDKAKESTTASSQSLFGNKPESTQGSGLFGSKTEEKKPSGFSFNDKKDANDAQKPSENKDATKSEPLTSTLHTSTKDTPTLKPTKIEPKEESIDNKTMDDLIIKWLKQLNSTSKNFDSYTSRVKEWDQQLVASGDEIFKLNQDTLEAEALQVKIDQHLMFVENQQDELEQLLDNYEQQSDILLNNIEFNASSETNTFLNMSSASDGLSVTDKLREKAYHNAELLDERLDNLGSNLSTLIGEINSVSDVFNKNLINDASINGSSNDNPIEEIVKLLNFHLENLKYIESSEDKLKEKLSKIERSKNV